MKTQEMIALKSIKKQIEDYYEEICTSVLDMNNKIPKDIATVLNHHFPSANVNITYTSLKKQI